MSFKIPDTPEELFRQGSKSFNSFNKWIPMLVIIFLTLASAATSFYTVEPEEVGVIRRFGKFVRLTPPGLHWKLPLNIERLDKVPVQRNFKEEFGFRTLEAGVKTKYSTQSFEEESSMLTGEQNIIDVSWIVQFKINDPVALLFNIREPRETVRDISESVMRQIIGDNSVSEALTTRRVAINNEVEEKLQAILDSYNSGIKIVTVKLQDVEAPVKVQDSFNAVNQAKQEKERVINEAQEAKNKVIPRARGEAEKKIREAEAYELVRVKEAQGDASKFTATWNAYKAAKDVTRRRLYLETLSEIIPKAGNIYIFEPDANNVLPLLKLNEGVK